MQTHKILVVCADALSAIGEQIIRSFQALQVESALDAIPVLKDGGFKAVVFDSVSSGVLDLDVCRTLLQAEEMANTPLLVLTEEYELADKLKALEIGCDDFIDTTVSGDEACARVTKSIFNQIANQQLKSRLDAANLTAHTALADNSDLGANIQFLLAVHDCDNLDQLGQQLFSTLQRYGLHCSLQMRSLLGDKNMEAHGMAKDLESQLLTQLADSDRFIDFGSRTIMNYDRVSLLVKNMPVDCPEKYGAIKDNIFCLLQGLNARIHALEDQHRLLEEKESLRKLSSDVSHVMNSIKDSYQKVMCDIVNEVENVAELIQYKVPSLALTEENELFLEQVANRAIVETNRIFNEGLVVDEIFERLEAAIDRSLAHAERPRPHGPPVSSGAAGGDNSVELF